GSGDHLAPHDRERSRRGIHHRTGREGRADDHRAQHRAAAYVDGEARARGGGSGAGEGVMVNSPLPALRSEYEEIARRLESVTGGAERDRKSTRLNSSHVEISYAVFCLKKKKAKT